MALKCHIWRVVKITNQATDDAIIQELGARLAQVRLERNLTQAQLAVQAGISKRTLERLESGEVAAQLSAFIRVCRALNLLDHFEQLIPAGGPGPMAQLKLGGRRRRRASGSTAPHSLNEPPPSTGTWTWGDNK
jgi:DNA-binding XRE family transcriptional regulator